MGLTNLLITIAIVALSFGAFFTYSVWYFFFSKEAVFEITANSVINIWHSITQPMAGRVACNSLPVQRELEKKLIEMEARRDQLLKELEMQYDRDKLRELNIICNHIDVTEARVNNKLYPEAEMDEITTLYRHS